MRATQNDFLPRLWATRRVGWLVEQIRSNGDNKELRDEIVELGTRYGIVTPYTSYLATDGSDKQSANLDGQSRRTTIQVYKTPSVSGQGAVQASKDAKEKQRAVTVTSENDAVTKTGQVKKVGVKTFYLENGVWIDGEFKEEAKMTEVKLKFASDEYFDLVGKEKDIAQYLSVGEQVVIVWKGKVYRITN